MNDTQESTVEQKNEWILEALALTDFETTPTDGILFKPYGDKKLVVDLTAGTSVFFKVGTDRVDDHEDPAIMSVKEIIADAKDGMMPTKSEPDVVVGSSLGQDDPGRYDPTDQTGINTDGVPKSTESVNYYDNMKPVKLPEMPELTVDIVKKYINEKVTDEEAYTFIQVCQARHLNPFLRQVHLTKKEFTGTAKIIVGKDGFMELAERNHMNNGFEAGIIVQLEGKTSEDRPGAFCLPEEALVGGWAKVYRKDRDHCFENRVSMKEYNTGKATWLKIPATMIRKTALVQALREAYPSELGGMYDSSEMGVEVGK